MNILITGGAGYIGSHLIKELLKNHNIIVVDNLTTGYIENINELLKIKNFKFLNFNVEDLSIDYKIDVVFHLAASLSAEESMINPMKYYKNNVETTISLISYMKRLNIKNLIFASSAAVYGNSHYGYSKKICEELIKLSGLNYSILRYFNPYGTKFKKNPQMMDLLENLKEGETFKIYGDDYNTEDGTCVRDYIHIDDLINKTLEVFSYMLRTSKSGIYDIGTGKGRSVLDIVLEYKKPFEFVDRRKGDSDSFIADLSSYLSID